MYVIPAKTYKFITNLLKCEIVTKIAIRLCLLSYIRVSTEMKLAQSIFGCKLVVQLIILIDGKRKLDNMFHQPNVGYKSDFLQQVATTS